MPSYEYKCPAGHVFEKFFPSMHDKRWEKCPTCGKLAERQISGGAGLVFKGAGLYTTDYKRGGEKQDQQEPKEQKDQKGQKEQKEEGKPPGEAKTPRPRQQKKKPRG